MTVQVLFFASIRELVKFNSIEVNNCLSISELKSRLIHDFPGIEQLSFAIALNNQIQQGDMPLNDGDIVALLPPFSGG